MCVCTQAASAESAASFSSSLGWDADLRCNRRVRSFSAPREWYGNWGHIFCENSAANIRHGGCKNKRSAPILASGVSDICGRLFAKKLWPQFPYHALGADICIVCRPWFSKTLDFHKDLPVSTQILYVWRESAHCKGMLSVFVKIRICKQ